MLHLTLLTLMVSVPLFEAVLYLFFLVGRWPELQWRQFRGQASLEKRPEGICIWVHASSVGEVMCALPLIRELNTQLCGSGFVLVTTATRTSALFLQKSGVLTDAIVHHYAPLDHPLYVGRFLAFWKPQVALFVESQIWPITFGLIKKQGIPLCIVNGRLSSRSAKKWRWVRPLFRYLLKDVFILCQDKLSAQRFEKLLGHSITVTGNLKFSTTSLPFRESDLAQMQSQLGERFVLLAASFHPGDENLLLQAWSRLCVQNGDDWLLILAPRHPEKALFFRKSFQTVGLQNHQISLRSLGQPVTVDTRLYIADTVGEMGLWYRLAHMVLMGGTFIDHGGQNPIEAAQLGKPIFAGLSRTNFVQAFGYLKEAGAVETLETSDDLVQAFQNMRGNEHERRAMGERAQKAVSRACTQGEGGLEQTLQYINSHVFHIASAHTLVP